MLKWPDRTAVDLAVRSLAGRLGARHPELMRLGYYGSYARGDWGVGSDVDLIAVVEACVDPFAERATAFDVSGLPVPADVLVYTVDEWSAMRREGRRFADQVDREAVWVFSRE